MKRSFLLLLAVMTVCNTFGKHHEIDVLPKPKELKLLRGNFRLKADCSLSGEGVSKAFLDYCANDLQKPTGFEIPIVSEGIIRFSLDKSIDNKEGYSLVVNKSNVEIIGSNEGGLFYGFQTFLQLLPAEIFAKSLQTDVKWKSPCVEITDEPNFAWRGVLLDVSREFQSKETVMRILDAMALCKLNIFHWHLTDDQGWRVEIKKYPKLTALSKDYYTQEEIKEIVKYASLRNITIVPEIDVPGHSLMALKAYPELACMTEAGGVNTRSNTYCVGSDFSYEFLENVMDEIVELFPSKIIHIGADEVSRQAWKQCKRCKEMMEKDKIENLHLLENLFIQKVGDMVKKRGREVMAWDEAFNASAPKDLLISSWRGMQPGMNAAQKGHKVVFCPVSSLYFDRVNSRLNNEPDGYSINTVNLHLPYFFAAHTPLLAPEAKKNILGAQACIWGEQINKGEHVFTMLMLRGCAMAENLWSGDKNWNDFMAKIPTVRKRFDEMHIPYFWSEKTLAQQVAIIDMTKQNKHDDNQVKIQVDVTDFIHHDGMYEFTNHLISGDATYKINKMSLLQDGKNIGCDEHFNTLSIDERGPKQFYHLWVNNFDEKAKYMVEIEGKLLTSNKFVTTLMLIPPLDEGEYSKSHPKSGANGQRYKAPDVK